MSRYLLCTGLSLAACLAATPAPAADAAPAAVKVQTYADLPAALAAIIPADARWT